MRISDWSSDVCSSDLAVARLYVHGMTMCMEAIMATAVDTRNNRVVVLVSDAEKRRIAANARAADLSVSDYMRRAAERYSEPTDAERALMKDLLVELDRKSTCLNSSH